MSEGLPEGWANAELQELIDARGLVTDGDWIESKDQDPSGDVRLIQLMDIGDGVFLNKSQRFLNTETAERLRCTYLEPGDVLIARMPDPLGRACVFPGVGQPAVTAVDVLVWRRGSEGALPAWLARFVNSSDIRSWIALQAGGTTRQRIAGGRLKAMPIPVPPLPEQRRIVAKLDGLSARSAAARRHLARVAALAARAKQAILAAAFRDVEASVTLGEIAFDIRYGTAKKCDHGAGAVPVLRIPNVANGRIDLTDLKHADFDAKELSKLALRPGDILIIRSNGSLDLVGRSAVVEEDHAGLLFAGYLIRVRLDQSRASPRYIQHVLASAEMRRIIEGHAKSTSGVNNVNSAQLASLPIPDLTVPEQDEIVRRIEAAFARIDRLADESARAARLLDRLDERLLAKAFRGELVPQDPADESAAALLARLRDTRAAAPKRGRGRPRKGAA